MQCLMFTMDTTVKLDGHDVAIKSGTPFTTGEGMLVTEDAEVVVNGDLYLLEKGDRISFSEAKKESKPKKIEELPPLPSEDEWEEDEEEDEEYNEEYNEEYDDDE